MPDIPESNQSKSGRERAIALARRENLTVRQLAQRLGGFAGLAMVGTAQTIADEMQQWLESDAADGFTVMFPYLPGGLDDFCGLVVPELQRRGIFRREYEGSTLRENLGLPSRRTGFCVSRSREALTACEPGYPGQRTSTSFCPLHFMGHGIPAARAFFRIVKPKLQV